MEKKLEQDQYLISLHKQSHYDKRLILKIVKEVEAGLPRKEAIRIYNLGKNTISSWLRDYGSASYHESKRRSYTNLEKSRIVAAIEQGRMTIKEAQLAYGIKTDQIIRTWLSQHQKEQHIALGQSPYLVMAKQPKPNVETDQQALLQALEEAQLKIKALNALIDVAEARLNISIRKKSGAKQS